MLLHFGCTCNLVITAEAHSTTRWICRRLRVAQRTALGSTCREEPRCSRCVGRTGAMLPKQAGRPRKDVRTETSCSELINVARPRKTNLRMRLSSFARRRGDNRVFRRHRSRERGVHADRCAVDAGRKSMWHLEAQNRPLSLACGETAKGSSRSLM